MGVLGDGNPKMIGALTYGNNIEHIISKDFNDQPLNGSKNYELHLAANIPVEKFWSVIVYDKETDLIVSSDQPWPSVHSNSNTLYRNSDGSFDIRLGSKKTKNIKRNWIQTIPNKGWYMIFRLYGVLKPWFDKTWTLGQLKEVK